MVYLGLFDRVQSLEMIKITSKNIDFVSIFNIEIKANNHDNLSIFIEKRIYIYWKHKYDKLKTRFDLIGSSSLKCSHLKLYKIEF